MTELNSLATLDLTIHPDTTLSRVFRLPVEFIYPVTLRAATDPGSRSSVSGWTPHI